MLIVKKFPVTSCGHEKNPISAARCLLSVLTSHGKNEGNFILATQDKSLKEKVRQVPGCPILSLVLSALTMEKPSVANIVEADGDIQESREREVTDLKLIQSQVLEDHVVKKRKRVKGPNPLSCKKKQKKMPDVIQEKNGKKRHRKRVKPTLPKHVRELLQQN